MLLTEKSVFLPLAQGQLVTIRQLHGRIRVTGEGKSGGPDLFSTIYIIRHQPMTLRVWGTALSCSFSLLSDRLVRMKYIYRRVRRVLFEHR